MRPHWVPHVLYGPCFGVTANFLPINKLQVASGRFISDLDRQSYFCVLGSDRARKLQKAGLNDPLGKKVKAGDYVLTIVGVLEPVPVGTGMRPFGINNSILIPISTAGRMLKSAELSNVMARMVPNAHYKTAEAEISAV